MKHHPAQHEYSALKFEDFLYNRVKKEQKREACDWWTGSCLGIRCNLYSRIRFMIQSIGPKALAMQPVRADSVKFLRPVKDTNLRNAHATDNRLSNTWFLGFFAIDPYAIVVVAGKSIMIFERVRTVYLVI